MINLNHRDLCENCFEPLTGGETVCPHCGFSKEMLATRPPLVLPIDTILLGKYVIGKVLGKGGFGITYLAYDLAMNRRVAIKEYHPSALVSRYPGSENVVIMTGEKGEDFKRGAQKFYEEAKMISRFNGNPNIISVYEFFYQNNTAYYAMEYLDGDDLEHYLAKEGHGLSDGKLMHLLDEVTNALMIVHSANLLHRDISPDNIFVCRDGTIKVIDFGSARQYMTQESQSLSVIVKPGFAPIEQYQKKGNQGPWTDIYALGATAYYMLTGKKPDPPFERVSNDTLNLSGINPEIAKILRTMLAVQPQKRFQTVFQLKNALSQTRIVRVPLIMPMDSPSDDVPPVPLPPTPKEKPLDVFLKKAKNAGSAVKGACVSLLAKLRAKKLGKKEMGILIGAVSAVVLLTVIIVAIALSAGDTPEVPDGIETTTDTIDTQTSATTPAQTTTEAILETGSRGLTYILNSGGKSYMLNGIGVCTDTELVIPETYEGLPVTRIGIGAFEGNGTIKSVVIPSGVTSIGKNAFLECSNLRSVTIPGSVTSIESSAFAYCTSLTSVSIPSSVTKIEENTFYSCTSLRSVTIPSRVTEIGDAAFYSCSDLTYVTIPESAKTIGANAFGSCTSLTSITFPRNVERIGGGAFANSAIKKLTYNAVNCSADGWISEDGKTYYTIFYDCPLESVVFGFYVTSIPHGLLFDTGTFRFESITIPNRVKSIGANAFNACGKLTSITLPSSLQTIENYAFHNCDALETVSFAGTKAQWNALTIGDNNTSLVFAGITCSDGVLRAESAGLSYTLSVDGKTYAVSGIGSCRDRDVVIPEFYNELPVTKIASYAFKGCSNVTSVTISSRITDIEEYAFLNCQNLVAVRIPDNVINIEKGVFKGCASLVSVSFPVGIMSVEDEMFYGCSSLTSVTLPSSVKGIGEYVFSDCVSLSAIELPDGITWIGEGAFSKCTGLAEFTLPSGLMELSESLFYQCTNLTSVTIPSGVISIGKNAFYNCTSLTQAALPNGITHIGEQAFIGCESLKSVTIPGSVKVMGYWAFKRCTGLTSVVIQNGVSSIGERAFVDCVNLKTVTIPLSVKRVENEAFMSCSALATVYYAGTPTQWGDVYIGSYNYKLTGAKFIYNHKN